MDQIHWFSGTPIRNVASIGGNVMNASPISDLNPVFVATVNFFNRFQILFKNIFQFIGFHF